MSTAIHPSIPDATIANLMPRAQRGERAATEALYDLYADRIYRYLLARTGDQPAAEDLAADVFVRALGGLGRFRLNKARPAASVSAWLYRIAGNLANDYWRARRKREHACLDEQAELAAGTDGPQEVAEQGERAELLAKALAELTEEQRLAVIGRFVEGLRNEQVAEWLGKSEGAVEQLVHRALRSLGRRLERRHETADTGAFAAAERMR